MRAALLAIGWGWAAAIVWLSLTPAPPKLDFEHGDKLGHFLAYGALMFLFCMIYQKRNARLLHAAVFVLMGVGLEFIPHVRPARHARQHDRRRAGLGGRDAH